MMERIDIEYKGICSACLGNGRDPKNRKRDCPKCGGNGKKLVCKNCGETMPCSGTDPDMIDQSWCNKNKINI